MNKETFAEYTEKFKDKIINGKEISEFIKFNLKKEISENNIRKNISVVLIGNDTNSKVYVNLKKKFAESIGVGFNTYFVEEDESEESVLELINFLNEDSETDAIMIQLPLPKNFNKEKILSSINPKKDIDGFLENSSFNPISGEVILRLLKEQQESLEEKTITIISNSAIYGEKLEKLFLSKFNNIIKINKHIFSEKDLENIKNDCKNSDVIISMVGKKHYITNDFIKKGAIVFDSGITKEGTETYGDAYLEDVIHDVKYITAPIYGMGPMTVAYVFENLIHHEN